MPLRAVLPCVGAYVVFLALLLTGARARPRAERHRLSVTVVGGYAAFVVIVAAFAPLAGVSVVRTVASASTGGLVLVAVAVPTFALISAIERRWRRSGT